MTEYDFNTIIDTACFDIVLWDQRRCYTVSAVHKDDRYISLDTLDGWSGKTVTQDNFHEFEFRVENMSGESQAVLELIRRRLKNATIGIGGF
jgi:hypothetical protein